MCKRTHIILFNTDKTTGKTRAHEYSPIRLFAIAFYVFAINIARATAACDLVTIGGQISKLRPCQAFVLSITDIGRYGTR
jgi:hypothetical protein